MPIQAYAAAGQAPARPIKVISLNMHYSAPDFRRTVAYLRDSGAEVIGLVEVSPLALIELDGLRDAYPYRIDCIESVPLCQEMLLSKLPFRHGFAGHLDPSMPAVDGRAPVVAWGEIEWAGRPLTFAVAHICRPFASAANPFFDADMAGVPSTAQAEQAAALSGVLASLGPDMAVMGDFNGAPWSRVQAAFRRRTGLADQGHMALSWPGFLWPAFRLPIDQVLVRGDLDLISLEAGSAVDSDHLPVVAEIAWH
jgi:endonuclease/exonuclease/phosphatase (EEP) superfamily protein YafD